MNNRYINVNISLFEEDYDLAYTVLSDFEILGIEEKLDEIVVCFEECYWTEEIKSKIIDALKQYVDNFEIIREERLAEKNWNEEWENSVSPVVVSRRIAITPEWRKDEIDNEIKIIINPKMSFGTGHHATTKLVCQLMENTVKPGTFWIDAGCGTGVLAILAQRLGAGKVLAFDNNSWSLDNARENFELNCVSVLIELKDLDISDEGLPESDGIAANLNRNVILQAFPAFYNSLRKNKGDLLVSGILIYDKDEIVSAAAENGFTLRSSITEDEWIAFHFGID
ncbi:MAG: ribosomal protein methyltransferase [Bacteroidota bacterium]|nr:ribosomal protein methyltransferase [Bacteroidota bacterium]